MKAILISALMCTPCIGQEKAERVGSPFHLVFEALPGTVLLSPESDGFRVTHTSGTQDEIAGIGSWLPNLRLGLGYETSRAYFDAMVGGGAIWNETLVAPMAQGILAARFKLGDLFTLGPHGGVVYFGEPDFSDDIGADFSDSLGILAGLGVTFGTRAIALSLSADYLYSKFDVDPAGGFTASDSDLDISGVLISLGIVARFP